jgi:hypothetical protein
VEGGYTFYTLDRFPIKRAVMVDTTFTAAVLESKNRYQQLELITANFGSAEVARGVGAVDAVILFDVLLHQVSPDWDEVLALYARGTRAFLIYNPQFCWRRTDPETDGPGRGRLFPLRSPHQE